jgi:hypothetical protein
VADSSYPGRSFVRPRLTTGFASLRPLEPVCLTRAATLSGLEHPSGVSPEDCLCGAQHWKRKKAVHLSRRVKFRGNGLKPPIFSLHHSMTQTQFSTSLSQSTNFLPLLLSATSKAKQAFDMVIISTLGYDRDLPVCLKTLTANNLSASMHSEEDVTDNTQTASILHFHGIALPIGTLFGNGDYNQSHLASSHGHDHMPAPTDGGTITWYCSVCGDGPIGGWQPSCTNCSHERCDCCVVEVHK